MIGSKRHYRLLLASTCASALMLGAQGAGGQPNDCFQAATAQSLDEAERRTVVITDPATLRTDADFSLGRTLGAIVSSAAGPPLPGLPAADSQAERIALLASITRSFRAEERINPESNVAMPVQPRPGESALDPLALLDEDGPDGMRAIGLFNRFDLAPKSWRHCGEHRIVYGKGDPESPIDRFFLIFEAALENPGFDEYDEVASREACRPVAEFWDGLKDKTGPELAQALEAFYFTGLDTDGDGAPDFSPVVRFAHYGVPLGQVRGNLFVTQGNPNANPWQLREWRVTIGADSAPSFTVDTVKVNPFPGLYAQPTAGESQGIADLRTEFRRALVGLYTPQLTSLDRALASGSGQEQDGNQLLLDVGADFHQRFNGFQSVGQPPNDDDPRRLAAGTGLPARIDDRLDELGIAASCQLTSDHVLNRAGALSCGGCHQFSAGKAIAPNVTWPAPAPGGFVHITESHVLSPALENHFLPGRREKLENFLAPPATAMASAEAQPEPAAGPGAAMEPSKTAPMVQQQLELVRSSETRLETLEAIRGLEAEVNAARARDQQEPGAFVTYRRAH